LVVNWKNITESDVHEPPERDDKQPNRVSKAVEPHLGFASASCYLLEDGAHSGDNKRVKKKEDDLTIFLIG
jgi:hypothetical protein